MKAVCVEPSKKVAYGSQQDELSALKSLSAIELDDQRLKETVISHFMTRYGKLSEVIYLMLLHIRSYPSKVLDASVF